MSLANLLKKGGLSGRATAIPATSATKAPDQLPRVARVARVAVATALEQAANDVPASDREAWEERAAIAQYDGGLSRQDAESLADSCCWPHSPAMNGAEIAAMIDRIERFCDRGLSYDDSSVLADKLVIRDREGDDRHVCLECAHLRRDGGWRCGNCYQAGVATRSKEAWLPEAVPQLLQRCPGYKPRS